MPISFAPIPSLNYQSVRIDPNDISGIADALVGSVQERGAKSALTDYANSLYDQQPAAGPSLGAQLTGQAPDPVNARIDQGFAAAGMPPGNGAKLLGIDAAPEQFRDDYIAAAEKYGVDPVTLVRQGKQESGFDPRAVSPAGATGIAQFMPQTAARFGIDPNNAEQSIDAQGRYMAANQKMFDGNQGLALAAYNWGEGNVQKWLQSGADPNAVPEETRNYVQTISGKPLEAWLGGGGQGGQPVQPGAGSGVAPAPTGGAASSGLPDRATLIKMLRNPQTRGFAADLIKSARTGDYAYQNANGTIVRINKRTGEAVPVFGNQKREIRNDANGVPRYTDSGDAVYPSDQSASGGTQFFSGRSVEAQGLNYLIDQGLLTKDQAANLAAGKTVTGPNGEIIFATPQGIFQQPPNGGQPTPLGAVPPSPGNIPLTGPKMSEDMRKASGFADRATAADRIISEPNVGASGQDLRNVAIGSIPAIGNYGVSEDYQQFDQAQRDFINAMLRRESGAAINESEFDNARKQYFPQPGDGPDVLRQKAENRRLAIQSLRTSGDPVPTFPGQGGQGGQSNDPLGIR
jgi:hypothetical protein